jgi:hypothetical protein
LLIGLWPDGALHNAQIAQINGDLICLKSLGREIVLDHMAGR